MTDRKWCPADWLDEVPPALGTSPEEFLKRNAAGVLQLFPLDGADEDPEDIAWMVHDLTPGEIITFYWTEKRGSRTVTIHEDGTWSLDEPFSADTNCFSDAYGLVDVDSLDGVVQALKDDAHALPCEVGIDGWVWSDGTHFRVEVLESGAARLIEVPADQVPQAEGVAF